MFGSRERKTKDKDERMTGIEHGKTRVRREHLEDHGGELVAGAD